jgi:hypothetical protein
MATTYTKTNNADVINGLHQFLQQCKDEGAEVTANEIDYTNLIEAIQDEYDCGAKGSEFDIISDLNDTIGLQQYGIFID